MCAWEKPAWRQFHPTATIPHAVQHAAIAAQLSNAARDTCAGARGTCAHARGTRARGTCTRARGTCTRGTCARDTSAGARGTCAHAHDTSTCARSVLDPDEYDQWGDSGHLDFLFRRGARHLCGNRGYRCGGIP